MSPDIATVNFSTAMFQRYQRSEQALILSMIEMVINGVSTRKIKQVTTELCGQSFSKSTVSNFCKELDPVVAAFRNRKLDKHYPFLIVDAMYIKVREDGRVRSKGLLIAKAVNKRAIVRLSDFSLLTVSQRQAGVISLLTLNHGV